MSQTSKAQIVIGLAVLLLGTMVYVVDRPWEQTIFVPGDLSLFHLTPSVFGVIGHSLPTFTHIFAFCLLTAALLSHAKTHGRPKKARIMKKILATYSIFLIAATLSLPVLADHGDNASGMSDRFSLNFGEFVTHNRTDFRLDSDTLGRETKLSLEDDLALDDSQTVARADGYYRFTHRSRVDFSYFALSRDGSKPAGSTIQFGDTVYPVGTTIVTAFDLDIFNVTYTYSFFRNPRLELGVMGGWYVCELELALSAPTTGDRTRYKATAPLPVVGLRAAYAFTPKFFFTASYQYFKLEGSDVDGRMTDFQVALEHNTFKKVGFGIGYDSLDFDVEDNDEGDRLKLDFEGVQLYTKVYF